MKRFLALIIVISLVVGAALPLAGQVFGKGSGTASAQTTQEIPAAETPAAEPEAQPAESSALSFDESISQLYDNSMNVTDEEVLAAAEQMNSDFSQVEAALGDEAEGAVECLKNYEAQKAAYMLEDQEAKEASGITAEWERQKVYTSYLISEGDKVTALVPRMKVTYCTVEGETAELTVYEWMTVGYAAGDGPVNASAYGYDYALTLEKKDDAWTVARVYDTDQNFDWMQQEAEEAAQMGMAPSDDNRVISEENGTMLMAASSQAYSYSRDSAISYGDKYCINYNSSYNSYKGKGGDCANFVSQCLFAGGFPTDGTWYKHSVAWINVMKQIAHFKAYGIFMNADNGNILRGNPLYFDWNGDGTWDHATICVGRNNNGIAIIDSHTKDLYHSVYSYASYKKISTIQLRDSSNTNASTAAAGGSWRKDSTGWWYRNADGSYPRDIFMVISGTTYHFNKVGYMDTGWKYINGKWYYFDSNGAMLLRWKRINGKKYYLDPYDGHMHTGWEFVSDKNGWYYLDIVNGDLKEGWVYYNNYWYYLKPGDGMMLKEWQVVNGKTYYMSPSTGRMETGWTKVSNKWYFFDAVNGDMKKGWKYDSGKWYFLSKTDGSLQTGWLTDGGKRYYLNPSSGVMVTGTQTIGGKVYRFASDGSLQN